MKSITQLFRFPQSNILDDSSAGTNLCLNFRNAPLEAVLSYLRDAADFKIDTEPNVEIDRRIDLWNNEPVNKEQALSLFKRALSEKGFAAIRRGTRVAVLRSQDAKKHWISLPTVVCE